MQDSPAKNFSSADSKTPEEFGELEEILEWEDEIDLAKEIAEIDKDDSHVQEISLSQIEGGEIICAPHAEKRARAPKEKFYTSEDISQDFFAVKHLKKTGGLLQAATKLRNIPGFGASEQEEEITPNFSIAVPNFYEDGISANKKIAAHKKSLLARAISIASVSDKVICKDEDGISVNEKITAHKKSLLARAISIASVSEEVICQNEDGIFSINENLETRGVLQDDTLRQLVDSVLKNNELAFCEKFC